jgi:hypothetical protein
MIDAELEASFPTSEEGLAEAMDQLEAAFGAMLRRAPAHERAAE